MTPATLRAENNALRSELITLRSILKMERERIVQLELLCLKLNIPFKHLERSHEKITTDT